MGAAASSGEQPFGASSTASEVAARYAASVAGLSVLVTGAASGLGFETARVLAAVGAHVTVAARSQAGAEEAVSKLRSLLSKAGVAQATLSPLALDLSSLSSATAAAAEFLEQHKALHLLVNNAGVMACPRSTTRDGLETQFGVNHVAHQHLTSLLLPALVAAGTAQRPSRVVNVSSMGNYLFALPEGIAFNNLPANSPTYNQWTRYSEAKLANILHAAEVTRRCKAAGQHVVGVSLHPGAILATKLGRHLDLKTSASMMSQLLRHGTLTYGLSRKMKSVEQGAATTIFAALDPDVVPGGYYDDCKLQTQHVHRLAGDEALAKKLWTYTEELIAAAKA